MFLTSASCTEISLALLEQSLATYRKPWATNTTALVAAKTPVPKDVKAWMGIGWEA